MYMVEKQVDKQRYLCYTKVSRAAVKRHFCGLSFVAISYTIAQKYLDKIQIQYYYFYSIRLVSVS